RAEHGRQKADAQHAMRDAAAENRALGIGLVEMERIQVAADGAELCDVPFADGARVARGLTNRQIFDKKAGDAWSAVHERFPHALDCLIASQHLRASEGSPRKS